ncbi:MAG TPA: adenine deaminase [Saprospiraceae bacterium]|nr:adenine deaminase [Saprospiraceae bacterium]
MTGSSFTIESNIVDILNRKTGFGNITVTDGKITGTSMSDEIKEGWPYLLPGFIDAHIHIESSMLTPPAFARRAVMHGTVSTVSDPHEIANVCGIEGVRYMVELGRKSGFKFYFGAPSCVPATPFETAGATLSVDDIRKLFEAGDVSYLAEMMNYPAVLSRDPLVMDKIQLAHDFGLPVDGHAPGLKGRDAALYASAGITTDHECTTLEEALDKIAAGMHIIIREGSAAKNYDALHTLIDTHADAVMFCSDDKHPDDLLRGHINQLVTRSLNLGHDLFNILKIACINPIDHYNVQTGQLRINDLADFILVKDLASFEILSTWIDGRQVYDGNEVHLPKVDIPVINNFGITNFSEDHLQVKLISGNANVIVAINGSLVTGHEKIMMHEGIFESDIELDILKIVVVNRYSSSSTAIALIKGFGLRKGAIASSVAHDSHNIVAVGTNDEDLFSCINEVIKHKGGVAAASGLKKHILPLPVGGLMSTDSAEVVGDKYETIDHFVKDELGSTLTSPFMTLSFMALLVIPSLKLSDKGLFDGSRFQFVPLQ